MGSSSNVSHLTARYKSHSAGRELPAAFLRLEEIATRDLVAMLQSMFDGIDDSFFELANRARTNNEQNRFFEAMREIRIKRKGIENKFKEELTDLFTPACVYPPKSQNPSKNDDTGSLTVVKQEDLEEQVAITSMVSKANTNFQGPLLQLQTRTANLLGIDNASTLNVPLSPDNICKIFADACASLEIELQERLIVFKQFDRYVMSNMEHVINASNKLLIRNGILPNLKTPGIKPKVSPRSETAPMPFTSARENGTGVEQIQEDLLSQIQALIGSNNTKTSQSTQNQMDSAALISMLNDIQSGVKNSKSNEVPSEHIDIRSELAARMESKQSEHESISTADKDPINLVSMLFEFILKDFNLAPEIQALISRLQIPILKLVIKDRSFFIKGDHPARKLLNSLARAAIGWNSSSDSRQGMLVEQINNTVNFVLNNFENDISVFAKANSQFCAFLTKEAKKARIAEQRTKQAEEGRIRSIEAQRAVEKALSSRIINSRHPIPKIVLDMLKIGWSRVMFLAYLKDDQEHQWNKSVRIVDELIACLQPVCSTSDKQRWVKVVPRLLKDLKSGLAGVSYNTAALEETISEIKAELTATFKGGDEAANNQQDTKEILKDYSESTLTDLPHPNPDASLDEYISVVRALPTGTWIEFTLRNANKLRCKLSTKNLEADCYIFVNRMGLKSLEKSALELATELKAGKAIILEQGQLIDRAMSSVMRSLQKNCKD